LECGCPDYLQGHTSPSIYSRRSCLTAFVALQPTSGNVSDATLVPGTAPTAARSSRSSIRAAAVDILRVENVPKQSTNGFWALLDCLVGRE